jgi:hypothetical protein
MPTKLILTDTQKAIFKSVLLNKDYFEIAAELHISVEAVRNQVISVICLVGFRNAVKKIAKKGNLENSLN